MKPPQTSDTAKPSFADASRDLPQTGSPQENEADYALITRFLAHELSREDRSWVKYRLGSDLGFRALAEPHIREWGVPLGYAPGADLAEIVDRVNTERSRRELEERVALMEQGIQQAPLLRSRPRGKLEPKQCVERLCVSWGSDYANELMEEVFSSVEATGNPGPWIAEVARARALGAIGHEGARSLIVLVAAAATARVFTTDSVLSRLDPQMSLIEREHGIDAYSHCDEGEGTPKWKALHAEREARIDELVTQILLRNGQAQYAEEYAAWKRSEWSTQRTGHTTSQSVNDDSREPTVRSGAREMSVDADAAELEALEELKSNDADDADDALITDFVLGFMSEEDMERFVERLRTEVRLRELTKDAMPAFCVPPALALDMTIAEHVALGEPLENEHWRRRLEARSELRKLGLYPTIFREGRKGQNQSSRAD